MLNLPALLDGLPENITILFFAAFSRFEYALMRCAFLTRDAGRAEADWGKLADVLGDHFFLEVEGAPEIHTLINAQPRKLVVRGGMVTFGPVLPVVRNIHGLLASAKRVRNNLFHGNKMFAANRQRDQQLMREVVWLLERIMEDQPQLRYAFDERQVDR
jgi:hypothetical protein